jgi:integrase
MHWSRHTAIQRIVDKTGNISLAQDVAGHTNISTTRRHGLYETVRVQRVQAETMRKVLA